jgi:hypothetical protein
LIIASKYTGDDLGELEFMLEYPECGVSDPNCVIQRAQTGDGNKPDLKPDAKPITAYEVQAPEAKESRSPINRDN